VHGRSQLHYRPNHPRRRRDVHHGPGFPTEHSARTAVRHMVLWSTPARRRGS
jgi:hypothetical protein